MARTKQRVRKSPIGQGKAPRKTLVVGGKNRPGPVGSGAARKPHRFRAGTRALMEIRRFQKTTDSLLPRAPFNALVREALEEIRKDPNQVEFKERTAMLRFSSESLEAIRDATEAHQLYLLTRTCAAALHAHRVTARQADLEFTEGMVGLKELLVRGENPRKQRIADAATEKEARVQARVDEKRREDLEKSDARKAVDRIHAAVTARKDKADAKAPAKGKADDDETDSEPEDSNPEGSDEEEDSKDETVAMKTSATTETDAQKRRREDREAKQLSIEAGKRISAQAASASASSSSASSASSSSSSSAAAAVAVNAPMDKEADNEPTAMLD